MRLHGSDPIGLRAQSRVSLLGRAASYDALAALTAKERQEIAASQSEILRAWALAVGPPLLAGLLPFGLGPMAAANYMQYVLKGTITAAARVFGPAAPVPVTVVRSPSVRSSRTIGILEPARQRSPGGDRDRRPGRIRPVCNGRSSAVPRTHCT
jgi:hypothetical protein